MVSCFSWGNRLQDHLAAALGYRKQSPNRRVAEKELQQLICGHRLTEEVTLSRNATGRTSIIKLFLGLEPFRQHGHTKAFSERHDGTDDGTLLCAGAYQRAVDLDGVEG